MRHSLLTRLLILSLTVAASAVVVTAWLTSRATGEAIRNDLERDNLIYAELLAYAQTHPSWDGVEGLVADLAVDTGQRIALTTREGVLVIDSAAGGETSEGPALPESPAAVIDPVSPTVNVLATDLADENSSESEIRVPITPEQLELRLVVRGIDTCFREQGYTLRFDDDPFPDSLSDLSWEIGSPEAITECLPPELFAPTPEESELGPVIKELTIGCIEAHSDPTREAATGCLDQATRTARAANMANPVLLYLGVGPDSGLDSALGADPTRTILTVLIILAVVVIVTVLAGRRMVRPVLALTRAARRMESGEQEVRVVVDGKDEISRLAHAFNSMADAIQANEGQRKAMISDIAHELRTPLANIHGYLEAAEDGVVALDPELVGSLLEETSTLRRLVADLQDLALVDAGRLHLHFEPLDAASIVRGVAAAHRATASDAQIEIAVDAPHPVPLNADPYRIRQALANLLSNALRYTPPGGTVTLSALAERDAVALAVADTGIGIEPEDLPHVFDRFYRADESRSREAGGSGLGLAITKHLVEAHGGAIGAESEPGHGTTFTITLPLESRVGTHPRTQDVPNPNGV